MISLSTDQQIQIALFEDILQNKIFNDLRPSITKKLIELLKNGESIYKGFNSIGAFNFEIDSRLEMLYVGNPFYLYDIKTENYIIDVRDKDKYSVLQKVENEFIREQNIDVNKLKDFLYNAVYNVELRNFCQCWIEAKKITNSNKLCYINIHDSRGFCCETAEPMNDIEFESLVRRTFEL
jgi:hypothetical protein